MIKFREFVINLEIVDLPLSGGKFTWYRTDSSTMSRFDWLLLFESLITCLKIGAQEVGNIRSQHNLY